jgi:hypothetical protein
MIKFAPTIYTTEPYSDASQGYNDRIKAFVDSILPEAFASADAEIEKCSMVQGLAARMLDYIVQSLTSETENEAEMIEMIGQMRENLFEV